MKKEVMLWNKDRTASVKASKIRDFAIYENSKIGALKLVGWFSPNRRSMDCFTFGFFETKELAQFFLLDLHNKIEGKE